MLEVMDLTKKYGKTLAADHIGFTVPDGRIGITFIFMVIAMLNFYHMETV